MHDEQIAFCGVVLKRAARLTARTAAGTSEGLVRCTEVVILGARIPAGAVIGHAARRAARVEDDCGVRGRAARIDAVDRHRKAHDVDAVDDLAGHEILEPDRDLLRVRVKSDSQPQC